MEVLRWNVFNWGTSQYSCALDNVASVEVTATAQFDSLQSTQPLLTTAAATAAAAAAATATHDEESSNHTTATDAGEQQQHQQQHQQQQQRMTRKYTLRVKLCGGAGGQGGAVLELGLGQQSKDDAAFERIAELANDLLQGYTTSGEQCCYDYSFCLCWQCVQW
jgi:hypothetical protein